MAHQNDDFDGYRKWLNVTSEKHPPTHYELLGIKRNEQDAEVIQAAVDQRRLYVQSKRGTGHDDVVSEILMRIDEAGITLLSHQMRRDYDHQLNLLEKRREGRQVDPHAPSTRIRSGAGRTVGEEPQIVKTFAGIMAVVCVGFGIMAWFSFQLPWTNRPKDADTVPIPVPQAVPAQAELPKPPLAPNDDSSGAAVFQGHSYKVFPKVLDWQTAKSRCAAMGGHLVTVSDEDENKFLVDLAQKTIGDITNTGVWLGATDEVKEGRWEWIDGTPFAYSAWYEGQPNNGGRGGNENYLFLLLQFRGPDGNELRGWCDQPNESEHHKTYFACEWDSSANK